MSEDKALELGYKPKAYLRQVVQQCCHHNIPNLISGEGAFVPHSFLLEKCAVSIIAERETRQLIVQQGSRI